MTEKENFFTEHGFNTTLPIIDAVYQSLEIVEKQADALYQVHIDKNPRSMTDEQKKEWNENIKSDALRINYMLLNVADKIKKMGLGDDK